MPKLVMRRLYRFPFAQSRDTAEKSNKVAGILDSAHDTAALLTYSNAMSDMDQLPPLSFKEERVILFAQLGLALARWTEVEGLLLAFAAACGVNVPSGELPLMKDLAREMQTRASQSPHYPLWENVSGRIGALSQLHARLTHGRLTQVSGTELGRRIALAPQTASLPDCLFIRDIAQARLDFETLHNDMLTTLVRLFNYPAAKGDYIPTLAAPLSIDEMREELGIRFRQKPGEREHILPSAYDTGVSPRRRV